MTPKNNQPMNRMNKIILCGLLLCLLGAAGKGYGQEVKPGTVLWEFDTTNHETGGAVHSSAAIGLDGTVYICSSPASLGNKVAKVHAIQGKTQNHLKKYLICHWY